MKRKIPGFLLKKLKKIKLLAMDVDGVLTAGDIIVLDSGEEIKLWSAKDRLAISLLHDEEKKPLILAWITGRSSLTVGRNAKDLGVPHVVQGCQDKKKALTDILNEHQLKFEEAAFIGDDLIDLPALLSVGFSAAPHDAVPDVLSRVDYVSPFSGGKGAVRDVLELILHAQKKWDALLSPFLSPR